MTWGKRARGTTTHRRRKNRLPHVALAALLVASLFPTIPPAQQAEALEGTRDYTKLFNQEDFFGSPSRVLSASTLMATMQPLPA